MASDAGRLDASRFVHVEGVMLRKLGAGMLVAAAAAACGDSTGPEDFDPVATQEQADVVLAAFDNPALESMSVLSGTLSFGGGPLLQATMPRDPAAFADPATAERLRALAGAAPSFGSAGVTAIFPADLLGATFVFDEAQDQYVVDPDAVGAPEDGVRVILYAVDPVLGLIVTPLDPIGYLDVIDVSTPSADALHLVAVVGGDTYLDYVASATTTLTSITLSAEGFVSDGTDQVDFDLSVTLTSSAAAIDYQLTHPDGSISLTGTIATAQDTGNITLTIDDGDNTVELQLALTLSTVEGSIEYNGDLAVEIGGTPEAPTFTRPGGTPLTQAEIAALRNLGELIEVIIDHFDNLLAPAVIAVALS